MNTDPTFIGVHVAVSDIRRSAAFYRLVGLPVPEDSELGEHAEFELGAGAHLALSTERVVRMYDQAWRTPSAPPAAALQFQLDSRQAVDALFEKLTAAGHTGHLPPFDAFCGSRYAEVDDPDGNIVGFHSPRDGAPT